MVANFYLFDNIFFSLVYEQKINILAGVFLGLAIYSYFYDRIKVKKEIVQLKKESIIFEKLIHRIMSEAERFTIKEMLGNMSEDFKDFKSEVKSDIKELISEFHKYKIVNNHRISLLEGDQKTTTKTIAIYITFFLAFIMLAINTYMSFLG